jgi:hypothetical protein
MYRQEERSARRLTALYDDSVMTPRDRRVGTYNRRLDFSSAVNIHAHPMSRRLVTRTVVGKNERDINRTFVGIRDKIPLLLRLIMDFVGADAVTLKLSDCKRKNE